MARRRAGGKPLEGRAFHILHGVLLFFLGGVGLEALLQDLLDWRVDESFFPAISSIGIRWCLSWLAVLSCLAV